MRLINSYTCGRHYMAYVPTMESNAYTGLGDQANYGVRDMSRSETGREQERLSGSFIRGSVAVVIRTTVYKIFLIFYKKYIKIR